MKRGVWIIGIAMLLLSIHGCKRTEFKQVYETESSTDQQETTEEYRVVTVPNTTLELKNDIRIIKRDEDGTLYDNKSNSLHMTIKDVICGSSINEIKSISDNAETFLSQVNEISQIQYGMNNLLQADGTFQCPIEGVDNGCMFIKVHITNTASEQVKANVTDMDLVCMNSDNKECYLTGIINDCLFDHMMTTDSYKGYYIFEPGQEIDMVLVYVYQKTKINQYSVEYKDGNTIMKVLDMEELELNRLYLRGSIAGTTSCSSGECFYELNID